MRRQKTRTNGTPAKSTDASGTHPSPPVHPLSILQGARREHYIRRFYPMNSPIEPVSPSPSSPSSDSPPPEDSQPELLSPPTSQQYSQGHSPSFAKRRLPSGAGPYNRDAKARKRDDRVGASTMSLKWSGSGYTQGDARESKKEELVDAEWMEKLKNGMLSAI